MKLKRVIPVLGLALALTATTACGSKAEDTAVRIYGEIEEVSEEDIIVDNQSDMSSQGDRSGEYGSGRWGERSAAGAF